MSTKGSWISHTKKGQQWTVICAGSLFKRLRTTNGLKLKSEVFEVFTGYLPISPENKFCSLTAQEHMSDSIEPNLENLEDSTSQHYPQNLEDSISQQFSQNLEDSISQHEEEETPKRWCLVCGDVASGFHYGVASCEACKAFFKRSIQGNIEYTCLATNDCEINKRRRKACQACRFQKCLQKGMLKEGVRMDRVRGGRQKYRRNTQEPAKNCVLIEVNSILKILQVCEPEHPIVSLPDGETSLTTTQMLNILAILYDKELVSVISWAKHIPGFTELSLNNQMRLLQSSWTEILTFSLAFRSLSTPGKLMFGGNFYFNERQAEECGATELFQLCVTIMERLRHSDICEGEFLLMKALILANSDALVDEVKQLKDFRDTIINSLIEFTSAKRRNSLDFSKLILCLPIIRQSDGIIRRFWSQLRQEEGIFMNKLFIEMLDNSLC